jgi:hypothetical protein
MNIIKNNQTMNSKEKHIKHVKINCVYLQDMNAPDEGYS